MVTEVAGVEVQRLRRQIGELESKEVELVEAFKAETEFSEQLRLGTEITRTRDELVKLQSRLANADTAASAEMRAEAARSLKEVIETALAPFKEEIAGAVRDLWSTQPQSKLTAIRLGVDYETRMPYPTISLTGGFATRESSGEPRKPRDYWLVDGEKLGTKALIARYGAKYNQAKAFADMTPSERVEFREVIVTGEGFSKVA